MNCRLVRVVLGVALLSALPALATVVVAQSIEEMSRSAPLVVRGRVGQVQASWDEGSRRIWTRAEFAVTETLKGHSSATVLVRQPGGVVGDRGQNVAGAAQFAMGEEALLFLEPALDEPGVFNVYALAAGKVNFEKSALGEPRAVRHLEGLAFYAVGPHAKQQVLPVKSPEADLGAPATFVARVKAAVGGAR